ncbi:MAG: dipeptidase [Chloroflexi bacterium]|nr:dipeptidase [Chloroflexota bacterium]MCI0649703.1 dipeptidase [Chloroflexota bacterium]MCI0725433.1 dipeptidase [Chloroflexota bacterium]
MGSIIPVFDGHNDTLTRLYSQERSFFERSDSGHLDWPRAVAGGLVGGIFAIYTSPPEESPERDPYYGLTITPAGYEVTQRSPVAHEYAKAFTLSVMAYLAELEEEGDGRVSVVRSYEALERNLGLGVLSMVLHFEGAEAIREDLSDLEEYYAWGLRSLGLAWSRPNAFAHGVPFRFPHSPDTGPGLTTAGKRLVRACNELGIVVDLAHLNEAGFWDVAQLSNAPLVVSHAGVYELCPSTRNLTDAQIEAVGETNGVIGIIFEPINTRPDGKPGADTPLEVIVGHIAYVAERIGVDHVAFGSDFDGAEVPDALGDAAGLPKLIDALRANSFDDEAVEKIAYKNWLRVFRDTWRQGDFGF